METPISRILDNDDDPRVQTLISMMAEDDSRLNDAGEDIIRKRRREYAEVLAVGELEKDEVWKQVREWEDRFMDDIQEERVPEWLLRAEAQDVMMASIWEEIKDHDEDQ